MYSAFCKLPDGAVLVECPALGLHLNPGYSRGIDQTTFIRAEPASLPKQVVLFPNSGKPLEMMVWKSIYTGPFKWNHTKLGRDDFYMLKLCTEPHRSADNFQSQRGEG